MVKTSLSRTVDEARSAARALVLSYAPAEARDRLAALLALDDVLAGVLRSTREPMVGQMRLTWWHEALCALDRAVPPAHPVLQALAAAVIPHIAGTELAAMIDGWEALLDEPLDADAMQRFASARGGGLFAAAAVVLGGEHPRLQAAGEGWALADLADHLRDPDRATLARRHAGMRLAGAFRPRWPRRLRALGALALLAYEGEQGPPQRIGRLLWHRATGL